MALYRAPATSRIKMRQSANEFRTRIHFEQYRCIPIVPVLESLPEIFKGWNYEYVEDWELPDCHARTLIEDKVVLVRNSVYERACRGMGRDRMTIAHELGYVVVHGQNPLALNRDFNQDVPIRTCEDPEWQAKCWAGEFMAPKQHVEDWNAADIVEICGVSRDAAELQLRKWKEEKEKALNRYQRFSAP